MQDDLKIKISLDSANFNNNIKNASSELKNFGNISNNTRANIDLLAHSFQAVSLGLGGLKNTFSTFLNHSITLNANLENLHLKLTGLIQANTDNVTSTGAVIDSFEKWNLSSQKATEILSDLKDTAKQTGISTNDMSNAFSMFYATASNQGSINKIKEAFQSVAYAVKVSGKNMSDLIPMFDSLASGTVIAGSEMGAFMRIIGLTNEELKKANENGNVLDLLIEKTAKFKDISALSSGSYNTILSQFKSELNGLSAELGKPIFETFKSGLSEVTEFLRANRQMLLNVGSGLVEVGKHLGIFGAALVTTKTALNLFNSTIKPAFISLNSLTTGFSLATAGSKALNLALSTLKTAFKTFLPTAIVFGALEGFITLMSNAKNASDTLANSISKTTNELKKMSSMQLDNQINELKKAKLDLINERNSEIKKAYNRDLGGILTGGMFRNENDKISHLAKSDDLKNQIDSVENEIKRLQNAKNGIFENDKGDLISNAKLEVKELASNANETAKLLNAKNKHLITYYEQQNEINKAWQIKEKELRQEYANLGFDASQIEKMVNSNKNEYFKRFEKALSNTKLKSPKIEAVKVDFEEALRKEIAYYDAIGDLRNKDLKERELKSVELQKIGLNELQIKEYFNRQEIEHERKKMQDLKQLKKELQEAHESSLQKATSSMYSAGGIDMGGSANAINIMQTYDLELQNLQNYYNQRLEIIRQGLENEKITKEEYAILQSEAQGLILDQELAKQKLKNDMYLSMSQNTLNSLSFIASTISSLSDQKNKTALRAYQMLMVARATMNTFVAASNAYAQGGPYLGPALAAIAIATGMAQVAQIKAQKFHTGGFIGNEPLKRDEVPAILQTGEYVLSRKQVNEMKNTNSNNENNANNGSIVIVNTLDSGVFDKWANSYEGRKVIKNVING